MRRAVPALEAVSPHVNALFQSGARWARGEVSDPIGSCVICGRPCEGPGFALLVDLCTNRFVAPPLREAAEAAGASVAPWPVGPECLRSRPGLSGLQVLR